MSLSQAEKFAQAAGQPEAPVSTARGWRYYVRRIVIYILAAYFILCLALAIFQKRLVFQPTQDEAGLSPQDHGFARVQAAAIETQSSDGISLKGWHISGRGKNEPATLDFSKALLVDLFFCGNAGNRSDRASQFRRMGSLGAQVVCFDYRGYGDSGGSPDEEGLARDARAAWDFLIKQGVPAQSIVLHGESLGGAVAIRLAAELCAENTPPAGVITEATFARMQAVAARQFPYVPISLILNQRFKSIERIPGVSCPLLMLHGKADDLVPIAMGQELFAAAPEKSLGGLAKKWVELPSAGHNDIGGADTDEYLTALTAFYNQLCPGFVPDRSERKPRERKPPGARKTPPPGTPAISK